MWWWIYYSRFSDNKNLTRRQRIRVAMVYLLFVLLTPLLGLLLLYLAFHRP